MHSRPAGQALACACCGTFKVAKVAHWDVLNVRSGPGVRFDIIHTLAPDEGCIVKAGERRGNWVRIKAQGMTGWVNRRYLRYIP
ncbi:MAG TPA: SH3 domain-containing protein [Methyloceanibacter sp.]|nr:SH3 domain-containing protein [Methyloceanibacter sp.]